LLSAFACRSLDVYLADGDAVHLALGDGVEELDLAARGVEGEEAERKVVVRHERIDEAARRVPRAERRVDLVAIITDA
jgi:hypothetical protein